MYGGTLFVNALNCLAPERRKNKRGSTLYTYLFFNALNCLVPERKNKRGSTLYTHLYVSKLHSNIKLIAVLLSLGKEELP
jgi:hypothetical protein